MAIRICEVCKAQIDNDRLTHLPETRLCTEHAEQIKEFGGEFKMTGEQERTSKSGSLKLNYGGIVTTKQRNTAAIEQLKDRYDAEQR